MTGIFKACLVHHDDIVYLTISYPRSGAKVPLALLIDTVYFAVVLFVFGNSGGHQLGLFIEIHDSK